MALDFLSAPGSILFVWLFTNIIIHTFVLASSVDAERAFSGGRLQVNHLQHKLAKLQSSSSRRVLVQLTTP